MRVDALRIAFGALASFLPWRWKRIVYRHVLRYVIHDTAYVGFSVVLTKYLTMGKKARIGHLNVIRGCDSVVLQESSTVGNLNWIAARAHDPDAGRAKDTKSGTVLLFHANCSITDLHFIRADARGRDWLCCIQGDHV